MTLKECLQWLKGRHGPSRPAESAQEEDEEEEERGRMEEEVVVVEEEDTLGGGGKGSPPCFHCRPPMTQLRGALVAASASPQERWKLRRRRSVTTVVQLHLSPAAPPSVHHAQVSRTVPVLGMNRFSSSPPAPVSPSRQAHLACSLVRSLARSLIPPLVHPPARPPACLPARPPPTCQRALPPLRPPCRGGHLIPSHPSLLPSNLP
jgi:hypothetical protein